MTCGSEIGNADKYNRELCAEKAISCMGTAQIVMPENYIAMFSAPQADKARQIVAKAEPSIDRAIAAIQSNQPFAPTRNKLYDRFMSGPVNPIFYKFFVKANAFTASSACIGCGQCGKLGGRCTFDDDVVNELIAAAEQADGFVFGSPVYYAHPSGRILSALDRAFYAGSKAFVHKPGAAVAVARRGGTSTTFDVLNKYFTINQMPVVASTYWNNVFGAMPGEAAQDAEGLATMRNIGKNMAWLLHCIEAGQAAGIEAPEADRERTNFIR